MPFISRLLLSKDQSRDDSYRDLYFKHWEKKKKNKKRNQRLQGSSLTIFVCFALFWWFHLFNAWQI